MSTSPQPVSYQTITGNIPAVRPDIHLQCGSSTNSYTGKSYNVYPGETKVYYPFHEETWRIQPDRLWDKSWRMYKKTNAIKMTRLSVGRKTTTEALSSTHEIRKYMNRVHMLSGGSCCDKQEWVGYASWNRHRDIRDINQESIPFRASPDAPTITDSEVEALKSATAQQAQERSLNGYDVLTELAEARQTLNFVRDSGRSFADATSDFRRSDPSAYRRGYGMNAKRLLRSADKSLRRLGGKWLALRYAVMPIVYSLQSLDEEIHNSRYVFDTQRARRTISLGGSLPEDLPEYCTYQTITGTLDVKSGVKVGYTKGAIQRLLARGGFNPFSTAWELVPYSFVVDWFIDVGDYIRNSTSVDLASQRQGWTSVKRTYTTDTIYRDQRNAGYKIFNMSGNQCFSPYYEVFNHSPAAEDVVKRVELDSYDRTVWKAVQPSLDFDPYLNWQRIVDGFALSYQPISKALRRR